MSCSTFQLCRTLQDALPKLVILIQCSIFGGCKLVVHFNVLSVSLFSNRCLPTDDDDDFSISDVVDINFYFFRLSSEMLPPEMQ